MWAGPTHKHTHAGTHMDRDTRTQSLLVVVSVYWSLFSFQFQSICVLVLRAVLRHTAAVKIRFTRVCAAQKGESGLENLRLVPFKQKYWRQK